ncbi:MAG: thioredoxin family protein, partial [Spirochaetaceae bacterium]|nr:thioredoxin family protein [Spirochaetaceae bacterium]
EVLWEDAQHGRIEVSYDLPLGYHQTKNKDYFYFDFISQGSEISETLYPQGIEENGFEQYYDSVVLTRYFILDIPRGILQGQIKAGFQLCNDQGLCLIPKSMEIPLDTQAPTSMLTGHSIPGDTRGWLFYMVIAFLGGILLNLMPCVLPLLSIKSLNLIRQSEKDNKSILWHSWSYGLGILLSMVILALVVVVLQSTGKKLGWGFHLQNPVFLFSLISIIFFFGLSLFDVYFFNPPSSVGQKKNEGYFGSLLTGIFAVLVATPCTAPFMGSALGFAFSQPPLVVFIIFISLGLGFASPFILLGFFPGVIKKLPKPGHWMDRLKQAMGFVLLATVLYLLNSLQSQIGDSIKSILWFLLIMAFLLWIFGLLQNPKVKKRKRMIGTFLLIIFFAGTIYWVPQLKPQLALDGELQSHQLVFDAQELEILRNQGIPVFLEFTADWCTTCKVNHRGVLDQEDILEAMEEKGIVYMVGDFTLADETIAQWLQDFGRAGVPLYIYYPKNEEGIVLPEILNKRNFKEVLGL